MADLADMVHVRGVLDLFSETGTEGGYWAVWDCRASHGPVDRCPWDPAMPDCPGTVAYWERLGIAGSRSHGDYAGLWILGNGEHLRVFDRDDPSRVLLDWTVNLIDQDDQYGHDAVAPFGLVVHTYPADVDPETFAALANGQQAATLVVRSTEHVRSQDLRCAELARLTQAASSVG